MTDAAKPYTKEEIYGMEIDSSGRYLRWLATLAAKQTIITGQAGRLAVLERQFTEAVAEVDLARNHYLDAMSALSDAERDLARAVALLREAREWIDDVDVIDRIDAHLKNTEEAKP